MTHITNLPGEILDIIIDYVEYFNDIINLLKTNKSFKQRLNTLGDISCQCAYASPFLLPENYFVPNISNAKYINRIMNAYPKTRLCLNHDDDNVRNLSYKEDIAKLHCVDLRYVNKIQQQEFFYEYDNIICTHGCYHSLEQYEKRKQDQVKELRIDDINNKSFKCHNTRTMDMINCHDITIDCNDENINIDIHECVDIKLVNADNCKLDISNSSNVTCGNVHEIISLYKSTNCTFNNVGEMTCSDVNKLRCQFVNELRFATGENIKIGVINTVHDVDFSDAKKLGCSPANYDYMYLPNYEPNDNEQMRIYGIHNKRNIYVNYKSNNILINDDHIETFSVATRDVDGEDTVRNVTFNFIDCPKLSKYQAGMCSVNISNCPLLKTVIHDYESKMSSHVNIADCAKLADVSCMGNLSICRCANVTSIKNISYKLYIRKCPAIKELTFNWFMEYFGIVDWGKQIKRDQLRLNIDALPQLRTINIALAKVPIKYILSKTRNPNKVKIIINKSYKKFYKNLKHPNIKYTSKRCSEKVYA